MIETNSILRRGRPPICSVLIVGMPSPAGCESTKTWRAAASFVEKRLAERFGSALAFEYAELFSSDMARHPEVEGEIAAGDVIPPIVIINGVRRFDGGKLNISAIDRAVAETRDTEYPPNARAESARVSQFHSGKDVSND